MAPEILTKEFQYSEKCDLWSLGIIIIFIITGNFPYQAHDLHHLIEEVKGINFSREYFQKNPLYKNISEELKHFLTLLLQNQADKRLSPFKLLKHPFITRYQKIAPPLE